MEEVQAAPPFWRERLLEHCLAVHFKGQVLNGGLGRGVSDPEVPNGFLPFGRYFFEAVLRHETY